MTQPLAPERTHTVETLDVISDVERLQHKRTAALMRQRTREREHDMTEEQARDELTSIVTPTTNEALATITGIGCEYRVEIDDTTFDVRSTESAQFHVFVTSGPARNYERSFVSFTDALRWIADEIALDVELLQDALDDANA